MRRAKKLALGLLALAALLPVACGGPPLLHGKITKRADVPAGSSTTYIFVNKVMVPIYDSWDESWQITFARGKRSRTVDVPKAEFERLHVGESFRVAK